MHVRLWNSGQVFRNMLTRRCWLKALTPWSRLLYSCCPRSTKWWFDPTCCQTPLKMMTQSRSQIADGAWKQLISFQFRVHFVSCSCHSQGNLAWVVKLQPFAVSWACLLCLLLWTDLKFCCISVQCNGNGVSLIRKKTEAENIIVICKSK